MGGDGLPGPTDAWVTLAALARETSRIRLGTLVTSATFRLPGVLAITVAQVDAMSGGRIELGLGAGWYDGEHTAYGIPFPPLGERFERLEEQFAILTGLWDHAGGRDLLLRRAALPIEGQPGPAQAGAAAAPAAHRRRRRAEADAPPGRHLRRRVQPAVLVVADTEAQFGRVRAACEDRAVTRPRCGLSAAQVVCCGADEAEVERRAAKSIGRKATSCAPTALAGTPDEVVAGCRSSAIGAESVYLQVLDLEDLDHLRSPRKCSPGSPDQGERMRRAHRPGAPIGRPGCSVRLRQAGGRLSRSGARNQRAAQWGGDRHDHHEPGGGGPDQ
jgi:alkanesulfonate monooxygenase SsuD/methylene tetrahydromethanopterin reductase-like flavin-dependent oxidoreductase (luciferase family)